MFGCGFVSFISWNTVSAYLARARQPLKDEAFSLEKLFLQKESLYIDYFFFIATP